MSDALVGKPQSFKYKPSGTGEVTDLNSVKSVLYNYSLIQENDTADINSILYHAYSQPALYTAGECATIPLNI